MGAEQLAFTVNGEGITDHIRHRFMSADVAGGIRVFNCLIPEEEIPEYKSLLGDILRGTRGFEGQSPEMNMIDNYGGEDLSGEILRAIFSTNAITQKDDIAMVSQILELKDDPIEYVISRSRHAYEEVDEDFQGGWITKKGYFVPVGFAKHDQALYDIDDDFKLGLENAVAHFEKHWVRISYGYTGAHFVVQFLGGDMTPEQKATFLKYLEINQDDVFKETTKHKFVDIYGYGHVSLEKGIMTLNKREQW